MTKPVSLFCLLALLTLAGCQGAFNPFNRPGNWSLTGASNEATAQQVANKADLISGHGEPGSSGILAVGGVQRATTNGTGTGIQTQIQATSPATSINSGS
ncbi:MULTISPECIES: hypothetical protein [unclassified Acidocella]|uniref:hypothetical protein n=1 Tax=unclassified Acidocella TaxID=2648610 RepID=UPI000347D29F|nr:MULTISPECIES: hypothetical protein [unclassified Acidocella]WBO60207.1 hypothetical protein GT370_05090 [Acidocella sp. MX-AZ03]